MSRTKVALLGIGVVIAATLVVCTAIVLTDRRGLSAELAAWESIATELALADSVRTESNAATYYQHAHELLSSLPEGFMDVLVRMVNDEAISLDELEKARADAAAVYEQIYRGTECDRIHQDWRAVGGQALISEMIASLRPIKQMARMIQLDAYRLAKLGKHDQADQYLRAGFRLADHVGSNTPILISALVEISIETLVLRAVHHVYRDGGMPSAILIDTIEAINYASLLKRTLTGEGIFVVKSIKLGTLPTAGFLSGDLAYLLNRYRALRGQLGGPESHIVDLRGEFKTLSWRPLSKIALNGLEGAFETLLKSEARRRMALVAIQLRRYKQAHDEYPAKQDAIERITDPYTGSLFLYRREGQGFLLLCAISQGGKPIEWAWEK